MVSLTQVLISADIRQAWTELAIRIRLCNSMLMDAGDPLPESHLWIDDSQCPYEKLSAWTLAYLRAATENLLAWANSVAPLQVLEGQETKTLARLFFTLARGGLEAAAQGAWVLAPAASEDRVERHVRLLAEDLSNACLGYSANGDTELAAAAEERGRRLIQRYAQPIKKAPALLDMVRNSSERMRWGGSPVLAPEKLEYIWRSTSAAAHGKQWWMDMTHVHERLDEYEPGYFRVNRILRPEAVSEVMSPAVGLLFSATTRYADGLGFPVPLAYQRACSKVFASLPLVPGAEESEVVKRWRAGPA